MPPTLGEAIDDPTSDDLYAAQMLAKDARDRSLKYSDLGLEAYLPRRPSSAPKPNTRFLRNILRDTDNHNAALRRKEEDDTRERLRRLRTKSSLVPSRSRENRDKRRHKRKAESHVDGGVSSNRYRAHSSREEDSLGSEDNHYVRTRKYRRRYDDDDNDGDHHPRHRHEHHHPKRRRGRSESRQRSAQHDRARDHYRRHRHSPRRSISRSLSRSPASTVETYPTDRDTRRHSHRSHQRRRTPPLRSSQRCRAERSRNDDPRPVTSGSFIPAPTERRLSNDSDPLEDLLGPLPPASGGHDPPPVRSRGRGAYRSGTSNIDTHFASDYNPAFDLQLEEEALHSDFPSSHRPTEPLLTKEDDWGLSLEALRDRARWKERRAERLRAAGFGDQVIERATSNSAPTEANATNMEGKVEDVKWSKKGEGREWDRGKVMDEDGHIDVKAPW